MDGAPSVLGLGGALKKPGRVGYPPEKWLKTFGFLAVFLGF
jgi:hypothetical protein